MNMRVLFFAKNHDMIEKNASCKDDISKCGSIELYFMTKIFSDNGWDCYWTCMPFFNGFSSDSNVKYYNVRNKTYHTTLVKALSNKFNVIIFRIVGSVEGNIETIKRCLETLKRNFNSLIINDPDTMIYGIRKDYLLNLQQYNFPVIPTKYFEKTVSMNEILREIDNPSEYLIKPVTGELSNSLEALDKCSEDFLRRKEPKVGGWLVQPIVKEVWDGEYQLVFFGINFSHGIKKSYPNPKIITEKLPDRDLREIELYEPMDVEKELACKIKSFLESPSFFRGNFLRIHSFRFDYIKTAKSIKILEFELVNPGFFLHLIKDDIKRSEIVTNFYNEVERLIKNVNH